MPENDDFYDADAPTPEAPAVDDSPAPTPQGAETVSVDGEEHSVEEQVASALVPGPNLVEDDEVVEDEAVAQTIEVKLTDDAPVDEVLVSVPGIDPEADYVEVTSSDLVDANENEYEASVARIKVTSTPVELPVAIGNLVAETPYAEAVH